MKCPFNNFANCIEEECKAYRSGRKGRHNRPYTEDGYLKISGDFDILEVWNECLLIPESREVQHHDFKKENNVHTKQPNLSKLV